MEIAFIVINSLYKENVVPVGELCLHLLALHGL